MAGELRKVPDPRAIPAGSSGNTMLASGVLVVNTSTVGNVGAGEDTLWSWVLPANTLSRDGQAIRLTAWGLVGANANNKSIRVKFGGTTVHSRTAADNNISWRWSVVVVRTGATTQKNMSEYNMASGVVVSAAGTSAETLSGAVTLAITGQDNDASPADNSVVLRGVLVELLG